MSDFFERMDRDYDGRLSFGEFMGEETPLEKVFKRMDKVLKQSSLMHLVSCKCSFLFRMVMEQ